MKRYLLFTFILLLSSRLWSQSEYYTITRLTDTSAMEVVSAVAFSINDSIYFGTGYNSSNVDQSYIYKNGGDYNEWQKIADVTGVRNNAMSFVINNEAYVTGGSSGSTRLNTGYKYNATTQSWSQIANLPGGIYGAVALSHDTVAYIITGSENNSFSKKTYKYNPVTNSYSVLADLPASALERVYAEGFVIEDRLYVFGGVNGSSRLTDMYQYNPSDNIWIQLSDLPTSFFFGASFAIGKKGYVVAGRTSTENTSNNIWEYTPETDSWQELNDSIPEGRILQFSTTLNNKAYFGGGLDAINTPVKEFFEFYPHDSVYVYDTICDGVQVLLGGALQTTSGVYIDTLQNSYAQDSIVVTELYVAPSYNLTETAAICSGDSYTFPDGTTQTNITAQVVHTSNLLTTATSCDSIITTSVNVGPTYDLSETVSVCPGGSYTFPDGTTQTNITAQVVHTSNLLTSATLCDSIITSTVNVVMCNLTGTVTINGVLKFEQELTASVTGSNNSGTLSYQWKRDNVAIDGATSNTYILVEADIATSISVEVTSSIESGSISSTGTVIIGKAEQAAPAQPIVASKNHNSISLVVVTGCEYAIDGGDWQESAVFTDLTAETEYSLIQRYAETTTHNASDASPTLDVSTDASTSLNKNTSAEKVVVYPNPASDKLIIRNLTQGSQVMLFDVVGNLVLQRQITCTETILNISDLKGGVYFVKVDFFVIKVIIE